MPWHWRRSYYGIFDFSAGTVLEIKRPKKASDGAIGDAYAQGMMMPSRWISPSWLMIRNQRGLNHHDEKDHHKALR